MPPFTISILRRVILLSITIIAFGCSSAIEDPVINPGINTIRAHRPLPIPDKIEKIMTPVGFNRTASKPKSFEEYLRSIALKRNNTLYLHTGEPKSSQDLHHSILNIDVGSRDLQQCADAVMRLRGEYLFSQKRYDDIHFNFLSDGKPRYYKDRADSEHSHKSFRKYMDYIFAYANTASLKKEMKTVDVSTMEIGDVFIQQGAPYGHAVIVVDMAINSSGKKVFLIAQSYMPAQDIHVLKNLNDSELSPWYSTDFGVSLSTPQWLFSDSDLKRF
ncbi:MAG: DUF4846 domain-containing protein [Flavobacteriales bacterium]|nr:DUF4846 domain-containing protein [Flavobacteriales bacterium]